MWKRVFPDKDPKFLRKLSHRCGIQPMCLTKQQVEDLNALIAKSGLAVRFGEIVRMVLYSDVIKLKTVVDKEANSSNRDMISGIL